MSENCQTGGLVSPRVAPELIGQRADILCQISLPRPQGFYRSGARVEKERLGLERAALGFAQFWPLGP